MLEKFAEILLFILVLGFLVFLHELGHYLTSKLFKFPVEEFGFGLPPRLFKLFKIGETEFTINALPFGAFVRPKGENDPTVVGGMAAAPAWQRLIVLLGGPVMNLATGILLYSLLFTRTGVPDESTVNIAIVVPNSPAALSGLLAEDIVRQINGIPVTSVDMLISKVKENVGKEVTLLIERNGQTLELRPTPRINPPPNEGSLGVVLGNPLLENTSWLQTIPYAGRMAYYQIDQLLSLPGKLIGGLILPEEARVMGPVGMFQIFADAAEMDAQNAGSGDPLTSSNRLGFIAQISVALGIANLLPIPALDGGRILFLIPEIFLRKRVPARYENVVHFVGMMLLLGLMVYITIQDILFIIS